MKRIYVLASSLALCVSVGVSHAQDLNVNCGPPLPIAATYGAASGQIGFWNQLGMGTTLAMLGLDGEPSGVNASAPNGGCDQYTCGACGTGACTTFTGTPDDAALLGSWLNADCGLVSTDVGVGPLEAGRYAAYLYTYGCPSSPAATVTLKIGTVQIQHGTSGASFQGTWDGFPVGRIPFQAPGGNTGISMHIWGTSETGFAGFQLDKLDTTGQLSCLGDGTGAACPCGNIGLPGHGCRNSATIRGAELAALGDASLYFDTLGLTCAFEPSGVTSIVLQGDQVITPAFFGDGLRCTGGSLKRLFVLNANATGSLIAPPNGQPSIAARSAALGDPLTAGAQRVYQVYYRDPDANFCPEPQGSSFNVSNAVVIQWNP
jgi:hypothetical protein